VKSFTVRDIRNTQAFPDLSYRFATLEETDEEVRLSRDFLGENPLHYYIDAVERELVVASNLCDVKETLEANGRKFEWEIVRAVPNNQSATIDDRGFASASPLVQELGPTLQQLVPPVDCSDLAAAGRCVRKLLDASLDTRLATVEDPQIGIILSGGLDSASVGYLLAKKRKVTAFTLKVREDESDIVQSRKLTRRFGIDLSEVKITPSGTNVDIALERYDASRKLVCEKAVERSLPLDEALRESLRISANPMRGNVLCAVSMFLIGRAIASEGIETVFCGEGPNEMFNDYGLVPGSGRSPDSDLGDVAFREKLTFGGEKISPQFGRVGLSDQAVARMSKVFAHYGIRLESPYFDRDIAGILTRIPHLTSHDTIKQHFMAAMFAGEGLDEFIRGTAKKKFQDGAGISPLFSGLSDRDITAVFRELYEIPGERYSERIKNRLGRILGKRAIRGRGRPR
jgi:asparagine synthetase B (glutamine-hydrolysing)